LFRGLAQKLRDGIDKSTSENLTHKDTTLANGIIAKKLKLKRRAASQSNLLDKIESGINNRSRFHVEPKISHLKEDK
jgi:hypothetical protein